MAKHNQLIKPTSAGTLHPYNALLTVPKELRSFLPIATNTIIRSVLLFMFNGLDSNMELLAMSIENRSRSKKIIQKDDFSEFILALLRKVFRDRKSAQKYFNYNQERNFGEVINVIKHRNQLIPNHWFVEGKSCI